MVPGGAGWVTYHLSASASDQPFLLRAHRGRLGDGWQSPAMRARERVSISVRDNELSGESLESGWEYALLGGSSVIHREDG